MGYNGGRRWQATRRACDCAAAAAVTTVVQALQPVCLLPCYPRYKHTHPCMQLTASTAACWTRALNPVASCVWRLPCRGTAWRVCHTDLS